MRLQHTWLVSSEKARTECVRILAETGRVDWNKNDKWGRTPLYWALRKGHSDIVDIIVQQPNIDYNVKTEAGETPTWAAVIRGNVRCVETLSAQEACNCWNVLDEDGDTPIMIAANDDNIDLVKILARCPRVDLNLADSDGKTLIERAVRKNDVTLVETLAAEERCNFEIEDQNGESLITLAHEFGSPEMVKLLQYIIFKRNGKELEREKEEVTELRQRHVDFLLSSITEKESDLECPVCLETAEGEIFSCVEQHLVCSQCRPRVSECPQCRHPYPPTPLRHRYAEKMAVELQNLKTNLSSSL